MRDTLAWVWSKAVKKKQLRFSSKAVPVSSSGPMNDDLIEPILPPGDQGYTYSMTQRADRGTNANVTKWALDPKAKQSH